MPSDPRCPRCNGKVSATATWCMHCHAEFPDGGPRVVDRTGAEESDLVRLVRSFDRNDGTRQVLAIVVTVAALVPLVGFGTPRSGLTPALLAAIVLGIYLRLCGSAERIVVHGAYGTAVLVVGLRILAAALDAVPGHPAAVVLEDGAFLVVALLVAGGWWIDRRVPDSA